MGDALKQQVKPQIEAYIAQQTKLETLNPFGIGISLNSWAGNAMILPAMVSSITKFLVVPQNWAAGTGVFRNLNYIYGCHPCHNRSFVSG